MRRSLHDLQERLLRTGIAPAVAARYVRELDDHCTDLATDLAATGLPIDAAEAEALRRLGSETTLVAAMAAQQRLRGWASRAPVAVFLVLPAALFAGWVALAAAGLVALTSRAEMLDRVAPLAPFVPMLLIPLAVGISSASLLWRQRCRPAMPLFGLAVVSLCAAATRLDVVLANGGGGDIGLALSAPSIAGLLAALAATTAPLVIAEALVRRQVRPC